MRRLLDVHRPGQPARAHERARHLVRARLARAPSRRSSATSSAWAGRSPGTPWSATDFQEACGTTEYFALDVFLRDGDRVFLTYATTGRGVEALGSVWTFLDLTPFGRQEEWEDTPPGRPQTPAFSWWRKRDEYEVERMTFALSAGSRAAVRAPRHRELRLAGAGSSVTHPVDRAVRQRLRFPSWIELRERADRRAVRVLGDRRRRLRLAGLVRGLGRVPGRLGLAEDASEPARHLDFAAPGLLLAVRHEEPPNVGGRP